MAESRGGCGRQRLELEPDGLEIGVEGLLEQAALLAVQPLAVCGELPAPHDRHLVGELVDLELPAVQLLILAADLLDQLGGEVAQLLRVHRGELIAYLHACDGAIAAAKLATKRYSQHADRCVFANALPRQSDHQRLQLLERDRHLRADVRVHPAEAALMQIVRAHSQRPMPSCTSTLRRLARRLANT